MTDKIGEKNMIDLKLNLDSGQKFYDRFVIEEIGSDENPIRVESKEVIHSTIEKQPDGKYIMQIEVFDRMYNNSDSSPSEEDFLSLVESIQDNIVLSVNNRCELLDICNFSAIQKKTEKVIERLSKKFKGEKAENAYLFLRSFYRDKKILSHDLTGYNRLGFFLNQYYGKYEDYESNEFSLNYRSFMKNSSAIVDEKRRLDSYNNDFIILTMDGNFSPKTRLESFNAEMQFKKIPYTRSDKPKLDKYAGRVAFFAETGELQHSDLLIDFSYGNHYKKTIEYEIKEVSHEEL